MVAVHEVDGPGRRARGRDQGVQVVRRQGGVDPLVAGEAVAALQGRVPLLPSAELALNTMLICEGIYLASRLGREVTAAEVREQSVSIDPA